MSALFNAVGRISCVAPRGYLPAGHIVIFAISMHFTFAPTVLYAPPSVSCILDGNTQASCGSFRPFKVNPDGSSVVTIVGSNFGDWFETNHDCGNPGVTLPRSELGDSNEPWCSGQCYQDDKSGACVAVERSYPVAMQPYMSSDPPRDIPARPLGYVLLQSPTLDSGGEGQMCTKATAESCSDEYTEGLVLLWTHHRIVVKVPAGLGATRRLRLFVGVTSATAVPARSSSSLDIHYAPPRVDSVAILSPIAANISNTSSAAPEIQYNGTHVGATAGNQRVLITGANFGAPHQLRVPRRETWVYFCRIPWGNSINTTVGTCRECVIGPAKEDLQDTRIVCVSPPGTGTQWFVRVVARDQNNTIAWRWLASDPLSSSLAAAAWAYYPPVVTGLSVRSAPTAGGVNITISGKKLWHSCSRHGGGLLPRTAVWNMRRGAGVRYRRGNRIQCLPPGGG